MWLQDLVVHPSHPISPVHQTPSLTLWTLCHGHHSFSQWFHPVPVLTSWVPAKHNTLVSLLPALAPPIHCRQQPEQLSSDSDLIWLCLKCFACFLLRWGQGRAWHLLDPSCLSNLMAVLFPLPQSFSAALRHLHMLKPPSHKPLLNLQSFCSAWLASSPTQASQETSCTLQLQSSSSPPCHKLYWSTACSKGLGPLVNLSALVPSIGPATLMAHHQNLLRRWTGFTIAVDWKE